MLQMQLVQTRKAISICLPEGQWWFWAAQYAPSSLVVWLEPWWLLMQDNKSSEFVASSAEGGSSASSRRFFSQFKLYLTAQCRHCSAGCLFFVSWTCSSELKLRFKNCRKYEMWICGKARKALIYWNLSSLMCSTEWRAALVCVEDRKCLAIPDCWWHRVLCTV